MSWGGTRWVDTSHLTGRYRLRQCRGRPPLNSGPRPCNKASALPRIAPIVLVLRPGLFNDPAWLFEPKYDGFRGPVYLTGQQCTIYSKRGNSFMVKRYEQSDPD
jgi:hypothetical protein